MRRVTLGVIALATVVAAVGPSNAQSNRNRIGDLNPISLQAGANPVPNLANDGRNGMIVLAWRDNGNAWGYDLFVVLLPTRVGASDWNVVGVREGDEFGDVLRDSPHTGEDMVRSVRFARGTLDGEPRLLLLTATRDLEGGIPAPSLTTIEVFTIEDGQGEVGATREYFGRVLRLKTTKRYCHAEMALHTELNLPLRSTYEGTSTPTGC